MNQGTRERAREQVIAAIDATAPELLAFSR